MPGAGGTRAAEYIFAQGARDGTLIGAVFPGAIVGPLLQAGVTFRYDPLKFGYIGSGDTDTRFCATYHTSKIKTFADLTSAKTPAAFGASGAGGSTRDYAYMAANLAGAKIKLVQGYTGTPPIALSMERGEVDGLCGYGWSIFKSERLAWVKEKKVNFLVQMSLTPDPELTEMGVPDFSSLLSGDKRKAAELIIAQQAFSRPYIAPPGVPAERIEILRAAFDQSLADKDLIAEFAKINIVNKPMKGKDVAALVAKLYATPKDIVELARAAQLPPK
jgi:tripartite-type tricarboxylate transporter receptor subunit TctC